MSAAAQKTAIVTGASSGLGLYTTKALVDRGDYHVVMAVRNVAKAEEAARDLGFPADAYTIMELELGDLKSARASRLSRALLAASPSSLAAAYFAPNAGILGMLGMFGSDMPPPFWPFFALHSSESLSPTTFCDMSNISFALSMSPPSLDVLLLNAFSRLELSQ